jgi:hypothetical protein
MRVRSSMLDAFAVPILDESRRRVEFRRGSPTGRPVHESARDESTNDAPKVEARPNPARSTRAAGVRSFTQAGPSADGWTIVAIHDSQESWERFRDEMLMPRMNEGIDGGFPTPPEETSFTVHNQQTG